MSPRTGRPPKENPRNCDINIRLTKSELNDIQYCADTLKVSRTDAIVKGIELLKVDLQKEN